MKCPNCRSECPDGNKHCPSCYAAIWQPAKRTPQTKSLIDWLSSEDLGKHPLFNPYLIFGGWMVVFCLNSLKLGTGYAGVSGAFWGLVIILVHSHFIKTGPNALPKGVRKIVLWTIGVRMAVGLIGWLFYSAGK